jgi:peptidoglycan/LPS O-acetylase OafA/YrhL
MVVAKLYRDGHLREASQWLFVPGVAVVVLTGIAWDLIAQGITPRWVGGALNLVTSTGFACVLISCLAPQSGTRRATSWRPLRVVGAMCFSIYCWHFLVLQVSNPNSLEISRVGLFLLTTAGITILSYRFIEFPQKTWRALLMLRRNEGWKQRLASYKPANLCLKDHAKHTRSEDDAPKSDLGDHSRSVCRRVGCGCLRAGGAAGLLRN